MKYLYTTMKKMKQFNLYTSDLIVRISLVMETIIDLCIQQGNGKQIDKNFKQLYKSLKLSAHFSGLSTQTSGLSFELFVTW